MERNRPVDAPRGGGAIFALFVSAIVIAIAALCLLISLGCATVARSGVNHETGKRYAWVIGAPARVEVDGVVIDNRFFALDTIEIEK